MPLPLPYRQQQRPLGSSSTHRVSNTDSPQCNKSKDSSLVWVSHDRLVTVHAPPSFQHQAKTRCTFNKTPPNVGHTLIAAIKEWQGHRQCSMSMTAASSFCGSCSEAFAKPANFLAKKNDNHLQMNYDELGKKVHPFFLYTLSAKETKTYRKQTNKD